MANDIRKIITYGSLQQSTSPGNSKSNAATIASVLHLPNNNNLHFTDSPDSIPSSSSSNAKSKFNKSASSFTGLKTIKVIESSPLIYPSGLIDNTNKSQSQLQSQTSMSSIHPDLFHHISVHNLRGPTHGTPHHGEAHISLSTIGSSPIRSVIFNMLNSIIGAGIVGLPYVYNSCGLIGGVFLMIFFAFISSYSLKLLIISARICGVQNYEDLCEYCFGFRGYIIVSLTMFIFDFGATLSYLIILGDSSIYIAAIWGYDSLYYRQLIVLIISIFIILPTILPRDISSIEKISTLSVFSVILIMVVVIYEWIAYRFLFLQENEGYNTYLPTDMSYGIDVSGLPMGIGIIAFAFVCHDSSFLLYNTLKNPTIKRWTILSYSGCFCAVIICACFAIPGYLTFGNQVNYNILNNYDIMNPLIITARIIYCCTMALTYPCSFFVVRHVLYAIYSKISSSQYKSIRKISTIKHLLFTIPIFLINVLMGLFIQNLGIVMSISGSLSAVILAFVLPTMCYLKICQYKILFWKEKGGYQRKWRAFKTTFPPTLLCIFGIFVAVFSTSFTIIQRYGAGIL